MPKRHLFTLAIGTAVAIACAAPSAALAASATVTGTITAGSLTLATAAAPTFSAVLNGTDLTSSYNLAMTATDSTGSGAGWNTTITSTQLTTGSHTLATTASSITGLTSVCAQGTCTNPTNSVTYPLGVPAGATPPTAVKFFNATTNTGMGQFTLTPAVQVAIPADTFAGTYTSTITLAVVAGP